MDEEPLCFEDIPVGLVAVASEPYVVTREEIVEMGRRFDPQPFHVDEAAGEASDFGGLVASGVHTISLSTLLTHREVPRTAARMGLGLDEVRLVRPVRPGDRLRQSTEIIERRPSGSRPDRGIVRGRRTLVNQDGDTVFTCIVTWMVARKAEGEGRGLQEAQLP